MSTTTAEATALQIIERHYNDAWRRRLVKDWQAQSGRQTKAKDQERLVANAVTDALAQLVNDLRAAGYTITEE